MLSFFSLLFVGAVAGILSGLLGVGGGIIVVPTLAYLLQPIIPQSLVMPMAVASSLAAILFISMRSTYSHQRKGSVRWGIWRRWIVGICLGSLIATFLVTILPPHWLRLFFAIFLFFMVIKLIFEHHLPSIPVGDQTLTLFILGLLIGLLSGLLGIGGGMLMTPILMSLGCSMPESAGTSSASTVPLTLVAGISFMITGQLHHLSIAFSTGYIYWPAVIVIGMMGTLCAPLGVKLSYCMPTRWIKRLLAALLFFVAFDLLK